MWVARELQSVYLNCNYLTVDQGQLRSWLRICDQFIQYTIGSHVIIAAVGLCSCKITQRTQNPLSKLPLTEVYELLTIRSRISDMDHADVGSITSLVADGSIAKHIGDSSKFTRAYSDVISITL